MRWITWLNSQKKPVKGHVEDHCEVFFLKDVIWWWGQRVLFSLEKIKIQGGVFSQSCFLGIALEFFGQFYLLWLFQTSRWMMDIKDWDLINFKKPWFTANAKDSCALVGYHRILNKSPLQPRVRSCDSSTFIRSNFNLEFY